MSNLVQRVLVAIVAIPAILFVIVQGGWWFSGFVALLSIICTHEMVGMARAKGAEPQTWIVLPASGIAVLLFQFSTLWNGELLADIDAMVYGMVLLLAVTLVILSTEIFRNRGNAMLNVMSTFFPLLYPTIPLCFLVLLRGAGIPLAGEWFTEGSTFIIAMFVGIWVNDSAAYFAGIQFGRHKILPRVSPGKSWEGWIAGMMGSVVAMWAMMHLMQPSFPAHHAMILGALVGIAGPLGDFAESLLKRDAGVKDSSTLIPGHGGVLDRFDSVFFVAPVMFIYLRTIV